ncbi:MAG: tetratricopeptide repeat protein [Streptomyces sp.]|nr:tetratricopeptide repeat protein [Streptomyces sp.]
MVPPRAGAFQDRAERARLRDAVTGGGTAVLCQVLTGMGGVGKTQLAADFAEEVWADGHGVDLLVWVTAGSRDALVATFAQAGAEVCGADPAEPERAARVFLAWLRTGGRRWLVVLDDLADPTDLTGLWPPGVANGRTVVTTRRRDAALAGGGRRLVEVGVFTPAEAAAYLASALAAGGRTEPAGEVAALAEDLGCLPLALAQAAAYVVDAGIGVGAYRELLAWRARTLADLSPDVLPDDQTQTVAAAWELSVEYADRLRPAGLARPMLELAAFLAPNGIPLPVLTGEPARAHLTAHRAASTGAGEGAQVTAEEAAGALRALHRLTLVTVAGPAEAGTGEGGDGVRVHQIVQRATRDTLAPDRYGAVARSAADALEAVWPEIERDAAFAQALRACTTALLACTQEGGGAHAASLYRPYAHLVLFHLGHSLGESGQVAAAADHLGQLAAETHRHLGPDHPHTFAARNNLARWRGEAGDVAGAVEALAALVDDMVRVLGPDDRNTLASRNNLARWRGEAGDPDGAVAEFTALLRDLVRVLGPDHPDTLVVRNNLARKRGEAGDQDGAAEAFATLLEDRVRVLGADHPYTLATRSHLAGLRAGAGDAAGAAEAFAEVAEDMARVLGPDHPDTFIARGQRAFLLGRAGDAAGSVEEFSALLGDMVPVLGPDHPDVLRARGHLAAGRGATGDPGGAAVAYTDLLGDLVRVLGPDHPDTLVARGNLAQLRAVAGDTAGAAAAYTVLTEDMDRALGAGHPDALAARRYLARLRKRLDEDQA